MKKTLAFLLTLLILISGVGFTAADTEPTPGIYMLVSYEVGGQTMDGSLMPNTLLILNNDSTGMFLISGAANEITYGGGQICMNGVPQWSYTVPAAGSIRLDLAGTLALNMQSAGGTAAAIPAAAPTAAPAEPEVLSIPEFPALLTPAAASSNGGNKLSFGSIPDAKSITVYYSSEGGRDGNWSKMTEIAPDSVSFTDETPRAPKNYYKVSAVLTDGSEEAYFFENDTLLEKWCFGANGKITSGHDYAEEISYEYVYEKGSFSYRKKTYENLKAGEDYTYDESSTKIGTSTSYAITLKQRYENCTAISFEFEIPSVTKGSPFGTWRVYVRLFKNKNWKEASTFNVQNGNRITVTKKFKTPFSIDKLAFIGPRATYSCTTSKVITSLTVKDPVY